MDWKNYSTSKAEMQQYEQTKKTYGTYTLL
jgi:hypothetical protein